MRFKKGIAVIALAVLLLLISANVAASPRMTPSVPSPEISRDYEPHTTEIPAKHKAFVTFMVQCESTGNERAINPEDLDGTASYGLLQFKPATLLMYTRRYHLLPDLESAEIMNWIFDGEYQKLVLLHMIDDPRVDFYTEFPACYKRWKQKTAR